MTDRRSDSDARTVEPLPHDPSGSNTTWIFVAAIVIGVLTVLLVGTTIAVTQVRHTGGAFEGLGADGDGQPDHGRADGGERLDQHRVRQNVHRRARSEHHDIRRRRRREGRCG